ncbi:MAG: hypothetical protein WCW14_02625 [Candidatus Paceibacterota bacterium]|jgi:hypothetical protein
MKLDEFITQSLLDIRNGVRKANEQIAKIDGGTLGIDQAAHFQMGPYGDESGRVSFDIAVTVEDSSKGNVGAGIKVLGLGTGIFSDLGFKKKNESVSRITFHVKPGKYTG